jgi:thiazole/oxazole-forming peptide maturase SagD family component
MAKRIRRISEKNRPCQKIEFQPRIKTYISDGSHRWINPSQTINNLKSNFSAREIVKECTLVWDHPFRIPSYLLRCRVIPGSRRVDRIMGKGFTKLQAYCSGIMEALERYGCSLFKDDILVRGSFRQWKDYAVDPVSLGVFREGPYSPDRSIDWIWSWNISQNKSMLVPALFGLYISLFNRHWYYASSSALGQYTYSDSNGCAAGNCLEEAILHGIYEVIERDAITINARNQLRPPDVELTSEIQNGNLKTILSRIKNDNNFILRIKNLTLDIQIPTFGCLLFDKKRNYLSVGYGTHFSPEIALLRAITELFQSRAVVLKSAYKEKTPPHRFRSVPFSRLQYLWEEGRGKIIFGQIKDLSTPDLLADLLLALSMLEKKNMDVFVVHRSEKCQGVPVVKVIIPSAQRIDWTWLFGKDLLGSGSDRIFRVPKELGFCGDARTWDDLDITQITFG